MVVVKFLSPLLPQLSICCVCQHIQLEDLPHLEFLFEKIERISKKIFFVDSKYNWKISHIRKRETFKLNGVYKL